MKPTFLVPQQNPQDFPGYLLNSLKEDLDVFLIETQKVFHGVTKTV